MLIPPKFNSQIEILKNNYFANSSIGGLENKINNSTLSIEELSKYFDLNEKIINAICLETNLSSQAGKYNRIHIEYELAKRGMAGLKWAAIYYGVTGQTLLSILAHIARSGSSLRVHAENVLRIYKKLHFIDNLIVKSIMDNYLQSKESIIFSSSTDRTAYLFELSAEDNFYFESVEDVHSEWIKRVRKNLKKEPIETEVIAANSFCSYTGLPISISRAEYTSNMKPGLLVPDLVSWASLIEKEKLKDLISGFFDNRFNDFILFTFQN